VFSDNSLAAWLNELRAALRADLGEVRGEAGRTVARLLLEALLALALTLRGTMQLCVYAEREGQPDDVSYRYVARQVIGLSAAQAHRARLLTCLLGIGVVATGRHIVSAHPLPIQAWLALNAAVLVVDPLSPLWLPDPRPTGKSQ
jgi:hypothetical protein